MKAITELLRSVTSQPTPAAPEFLEDVLTELQRYGQPRLGIYSERGWHAYIEVTVTAVGARFDIRSEYSHDTPLEAALECRKRLRAALATLGGKA